MNRINRIALLAVALFSLSAFSQSTVASDSFITSRQVEVERIAETLYSTRLSGSGWSRHILQHCGAFQHHSFASFDTAPKMGVRFVAIYDLDHAAARSADKPWGGGITLLRLKIRADNQEDSDPSQVALLSAFNRIVGEENAGRRVSMDLAKEAICFVDLLGGQLEAIKPQASPEETSSTPPVPVKISSILIPLVSGPGVRRTASLEFGPNETIVRASITEQRHP